MDYRKTFVRIKGERHFEQVKEAYKRSGCDIIAKLLYKQKMGYVRIDEIGRYGWGSERALKEFTAGYTELILRNGQLVPAVEPVDWSQRYVRVNGQAEYDAAIAAFVKMTGFKLHGEEKNVNHSDGYVGVVRDDPSRRVASYSNTWHLRGTEAQLIDLLAEARIELPKPKDRRTRIRYEEETGRITSIENCLTREECAKVAPGYLDGTPCYWVEGGKLCVTLSFGSIIYLRVGEEPFSVTSWPRVEKCMKEAGERFTACKKAAAENAKAKIIEVVI
ncbi:MAG: hypothetical protein HGA87_01570 [Desulfobulbaceae bacterium]|nr:hypothetical protein [Desulfobulbaceae bacterium]